MDSQQTRLLSTDTGVSIYLNLSKFANRFSTLLPSNKVKNGLKKKTSKKLNSQAWLALLFLKFAPLIQTLDALTHTKYQHEGA